MPKIIRVTTVPISLKFLLPGQMRFMRENGFEVIMASSDGPELAEVISSEGCRHQVIDLSRKITPVRDAKAVMSMYRFFRREKPDIVHSHTPKAGLIAMLAAKMAGVPVRIHTIAGLRFVTTTGNLRKVLVAMEKLTAAVATHVWPNSFSMLRYIKSNRIVAPSKMKVIGAGSSNGIDLQRFSVPVLKPELINETKQQISYDPGLEYILAIGRIVKDKGIEELLDVFQSVKQERPHARLVLVGSFEPELDPLDARSQDILKNDPDIIHISWSEKVEYFMHLAAVLVHASHREGFPNVLLQAGAMLCPIVCSDIDGNIDVVEDGKTGLLFGVKNKEEMRAKLLYALSNREEMSGFANGLRKRIESDFDQKVVHRNIKDAYLEILDDKNHP